MSCHFCYWSSLFNFVSFPWKVLVKCEPRLIKAVRKNGHKAKGLQGVFPSPEGTAATGTAWPEHRNDGYEFHGIDSLTGAAWNRFPEKLISCSGCSWLCLFAGLCVISSEGIMPCLCCHSYACVRSQQVMEFNSIASLIQEAVPLKY